VLLRTIGEERRREVQVPANVDDKVSEVLGALPQLFRRPARAGQTQHLADFARQHCHLIGRCLQSRSIGGALCQRRRQRRGADQEPTYWP
jgi:hypothetical protein